MRGQQPCSTKSSDFHGHSVDSMPISEEIREFDGRMNDHGMQGNPDEFKSKRVFCRIFFHWWRTGRCFVAIESEAVREEHLSTVFDTR